MILSVQAAFQSQLTDPEFGAGEPSARWDDGGSPRYYGQSMGEIAAGSHSEDDNPRSLNHFGVSGDAQILYANPK